MSASDPLGGWSSLPADNVPVNFSGHARERFAERLRSGNPGTVDELSRMLAAAVVTTKRPDWLPAQRADAYLLLGEDVVCPLAQHRDGELMALTMIVRGMMGDRRRAGRNKSKSWKRDGRRRSRVAQKLDGGRPARGPDAAEWSDDDS